MTMDWPDAKAPGSIDHRPQSITWPASAGPISLTGGLGRHTQCSAEADDVVLKPMIMVWVMLLPMRRVSIRRAACHST